MTVPLFNNKPCITYILKEMQFFNSNNTGRSIKNHSVACISKMTVRLETMKST